MMMTTLALLAFVLLLAQIAVRTTYEFRLNLGDNANEVLGNLQARYSEQPNGRPLNSANTFQQRHPIIALIGLVLGVRFATWILAWLLYMVRENRFVGFFESMKAIWWRWDAVHYLNIADHGYVREAMPEKLNLVFYPLYPSIVSLVKLAGVPLFAASILVSLAAFCAASLILYKLVERETANPQLAWDSCKILAIFPFSFFFAMPYTESLFLLLTLASFWFLRDGRWLAAGAVAALAGLTRNQGILLAVPFVFEIAQRWRNGELKHPYRAAIGLMLVPLGFLAYLALNKYISGEWFRFLIYQKQNWSQSFGFMPRNVAGALESLINGEVHLGLGTWLPTLVCYFAAIGVLLASSRKIPLPYLAYSAIYLLVSYSPSWLLSGPRYLMSLFPLAIAAAILMQRSHYWHQAIEFVMLAGLGFFLLMYIQFQVY